MSIIKGEYEANRWWYRENEAKDGEKKPTAENEIQSHHRKI